jgi:hypothetical protein
MSMSILGPLDIDGTTELNKSFIRTASGYSGRGFFTRVA